MKAIAERARDGDGHARETFTGFAEALGEFVEPWRAGFRPTSVVVGGAIARAWDLLGPTLEPRLTRAAHLDDAPLLGAARWVDR